MRGTVIITVGVDDELPSRVAVDWAIRQASRVQARIVLLTALGSIRADRADVRELLEAERSRILEQATRPVVVDAVIARGTRLTALTRFSRRSDLLVIGSRRARPGWTSGGGVPRRLVRSASRPVVVVPEDWEPREGAIVVGVADDASSDAAVAWAADHAASRGADLHVVHAWTSSDIPLDGERVHRERLEATIRDLREHHPVLEIRGTTLEGGANTALVAAAVSAELVVVGSHRRGVIAGLVLGSTADDLLRYARTPICVVPSRPVGRSRISREPVRS